MASPVHTSGGTAILCAEHEQVLRVLTLAERMAEGAPPPADVEALVGLLTHFVDGLHHTKEERHLFPLLERKGLPRVGGPIGVMLAEHERGRALIDEIAARRAALGGERSWGDAARDYAALMRRHIEKENTVLFVMAERLLSGAEQDALARACAELNAQPPGRDALARLAAELTRLERAYPACP